MMNFRKQWDFWENISSRSWIRISLCQKHCRNIPLVPQVRRCLDSEQNYTPSSPGSLACRLQTVGILRIRNRVSQFLLINIHVCAVCLDTQLWLFATLCTVAHHASLFMAVFRQFLFLFQGIFLTQGSNLCLLIGRHILTTEPPEKPHIHVYLDIYWASGWLSN